MANVNAPRGLIPVRYTSGAPYSGSANMYYVPSTYATALYVGDPVIATGASDANGTPVVQIATAGGGTYCLGAVVGIVAGGDPQIAVTRDLPVYRQASVSQYILVADDPNLLFVIQDNSTTSPIAMATAGTKNADLVAGAGSTITGYSGWMLNAATLNTTATLQLRVVQGLRETDNQMAASYARWLVKINLHSLMNTTGI